ncbi:MAG: hypothetical protein VB017_07555 [Endomicrobiaceae bacterium]|nr:hypothetical protein [Endomicrobiaceae bacterium]
MKIDLELILKIAQLFTPILIFIFGILFLKSIESTKKHIERQSHFYKKWADEFFNTCDDFMKCTERMLALFWFIASNPNINEACPNYQKEFNDLFPALLELKLRIRRLVPFAPKFGNTVGNNASEIFTKLSELFEQKKGNVDPIVNLIFEFNKAAKLAHGEMLANKK